MTTGKRHWMKFFPADWRQDPRLRMCDLATRGLWMEMLCLMAEGEPYGHLTVGGAAIKDSDLARLAGADLKTVRKSLLLLSHVGVCSTTSSGVVFSRRMVADHAKALKDKANGSSGGNPRLTGGVNPQDKTHAGEARSHKPERTPVVPTERPAASPEPAGPKASGLKSADLIGPVDALVQRLENEFPEFKAARGNIGLMVTQPLVALALDGCDLDRDVENTIRGVLARKPKRMPKSWTYFRDAILEARDERLAAPASSPRSLSAKTAEDYGALSQDADGTWRVALDEAGVKSRPAADSPEAIAKVWPRPLAHWLSRVEWFPALYGPAPGQPGCIVPQEALDEAERCRAERVAAEVHRQAERHRLEEAAAAYEAANPSGFGDAPPRTDSTRH